MSTAPFSAIAERTFRLQGPAERTVIVRIGVPEPDAEHAGCFRCPFHVSGLSDDGVRCAVGVDSFQALNLAFGGIRSFIKTNASVLTAFHKDFSLTQEGGSWELSLPISVSCHDSSQLERLEHFLVHDFWKKNADSDV